MKRENAKQSQQCLQSPTRSYSLFRTPVLDITIEAERTKHAQELVRIERAHNKDLTNVVKTLTEELSQAREDVRKSLDETKSIRDWLGYETEENKETNKDRGYRHKEIRCESGKGPKARNQKVILKCSTKEDMEAIQNKMRSRKEIKVEGQSGEPLLIMKGEEGTQPTTVPPSTRTKPVSTKDS
ncbi:hypothetical protein EVAR_85895_1 [Eumeta japonica]|uniref:Uncharacterized protein n=1 Tax=Eumeta variegata TaxID=151549 RepID=A0A4C2A7C2_EUMVA|nr:hypothetical protein EVAR_85895_1 [Eumeta japonica]